ncbi:MAG TPA: ATP-dependent 6-phosphofructokinase, partial [Clostridiales bacterium]|nr:ATP-dependent 6-phosphofructokinase [Clostridiales bacterium]
MSIKRIGVLTSGGDTSGMNAAIRAVVRTSIYYGLEPIGIARGYAGLVDGDFTPMTFQSVSRIMRQGGTVLYSDRCEEFKTPEGQKKAYENCVRAGIEGIVVIGGDGTFRGAGDMGKMGISCICIPGTIDNDITATDYSIGFDTALDTIMEMVDRLKDTCVSHARCSIVEVMGRGAGLLALYSGLACGAAGIIVKEKCFDEEIFFEKMRESKQKGRRDFVVIVSENMGEHFAEDLCKRITEETGIYTRFARLAHVQRGGVPTVR